MKRSNSPEKFQYVRKTTPVIKKNRTGIYLLTLLTVVLVAVALIFVNFYYINSIVNKNVVIEAGTSVPAAAAFAKDTSYSGEYVSDLAGVNTAIPGRYDLQVRINNRIYDVTLEIIDTTAPTAEPVDREIWLGETVEASQFAANASDISLVVCSFKTQPDLQLAGQQAVTVILTDASGNASELTAMLNVRKDDQAPVISGVADQTVYIGDPVSYRENVTVSDNHDTNIQLQIDNSAVNLTVAGDYTVTYSAVDAAGNTAQATAIISVKAKPPGYVSEADLNVLLDQILGEIITTDSSDLDKLTAIFKWIASNVDYNSSEEKDDWVKAAYQGIKTGSGDCFIFYSTAKALLERAGFECVKVERIQGTKTRHYWNLVNYNGQYYHFDAMPILTYYDYVCLLRTDAEIDEYTRVRGKNDNFYTYDHTGMPTVATVPLDIERPRIIG